MSTADAPPADSPTRPLRWTVHTAVEDDDPELLALFEEVFGHAMPPEQWRWKYSGSPVRGTMLRKDGRVVAFYGAMPRRARGPDRVYEVVQIGDVMVKPDERGVFTKRGAIYHVTAEYIKRFVGPGRQKDWGYGFPNERAFGVAERLGLYIEGDRVVNLGWAPLVDPSRPWWLREVEMDERSIGAVDRLWEDMRRDWPGLYIPVRDAQRWRFRFLQHPSVKYHLLLVRRLDGKPIAAVALRDHPTHVEWLDFVGSRARVPHALAAARRFAGRNGPKPLTAMCTKSIAPLFALESAQTQPSNIVVPLPGELTGGTQPYPWQGKLWLMGGDTDFL